MRIGIITTWFDRGAAMVSRAYRDILLAQGHEVFVYARGGEKKAKGDPKWDGENVTWDRGSMWEWTSVKWSNFRRWVADRKLDILFFNEQKYWPVVVFARREFEIPIGSYVDYYTSQTVPFYELFDFLVCNTRRHLSVFQWHRQAFYVPWGTDCSTFSGTCTPVEPGKVVFFHSAGMSPGRKGTEIAVEAFTILEGDARFVLHIQAPLEKFPALAKMIAADPRIQVINKTVGAPGLYHLGDVYVYPTILEGIGLTIMEALACGLPVITTGCPPMTEFVKHGVNGRLVNPTEYRGRYDGYYWAEAYCSPETVREAMQEYVKQVDSIGILKRAARASAEASIDWRKNAAALGNLFEKAASTSRNRADLWPVEQSALSFKRLPLVRRALVNTFSQTGWHFNTFLARLYCR